jgi:hypothetical protein
MSFTDVKNQLTYLKEQLEKVEQEIERLSSFSSIPEQGQVWKSVDGEFFLLAEEHESKKLIAIRLPRNKDSLVAQFFWGTPKRPEVVAKIFDNLGLTLVNNYTWSHVK